jgi:hypothetical protein
MSLNTMHLGKYLKIKKSNKMEIRESVLTALDVIKTKSVPKETRTYKPVSHEELIHVTMKAIEDAGFTLDSQRYSVARDGNVANGRYIIKNVSDGEMQLQIGWQNSYDKSLSLKFAIGTHIIVCENGCVSGDFGAFKKKHVGEVKTFTPATITEYISQAGDTFTNLQKQRDLLKNVELTARRRSELVGMMVMEQDFIQATQIKIIKGQIENPSFDYGAPGSAWELYQHVTYSMKDIHPSLWMEHHQDAHEFFVNEVLA